MLCTRVSFDRILTFAAFCLQNLNVTSCGSLLQCFLRMACVRIPRRLRACVWFSRADDKEKACVAGFFLLILLALGVVLFEFYQFEEPDMTKIDLSERRQRALINEYKSQRDAKSRRHSLFSRTKQEDWSDEHENFDHEI